MTDLTTHPDRTGEAHPLRCPRCEVTWRGAAGDACWCCGIPGVAHGHWRIVDDEPAA